MQVVILFSMFTPFCDWPHTLGFLRSKNNTFASYVICVVHVPIVQISNIIMCMSVNNTLVLEILTIGTCMHYNITYEAKTYIFCSKLFSFSLFGGFNFLFFN